MDITFSTFIHIHILHIYNGHIRILRTLLQYSIHVGVVLVLVQGYT